MFLVPSLRSIVFNLLKELSFIAQKAGKSIVHHFLNLHDSLKNLTPFLLIKSFPHYSILKFDNNFDFYEHFLETEFTLRIFIKCRVIVFCYIFFPQWEVNFYFCIIYLVTLQMPLALPVLILIIVFINQIIELIYISQNNIGGHYAFLYPFCLAYP